MLTSGNSQLLSEEKSSLVFRFAAAACAVLVTAVLFSGYAYFRRRHAQQTVAPKIEAQSLSALPRGPAKAHVFVDDALLQGPNTLIGGTVKNISSGRLGGLSVELELQRRKDGSVEQKSLPVEPAQLEPDQEGRYSLKLKAQDYSSVRLTGLKSATESELVYRTSPGQKRPLERLQPKVVTVPRAPSRGDGFLNSPDNPARVP